MDLSTLSGCRVLVVEDEEFIAADIVIELEQWGAEVIGPADSLPVALDLIATTQPDVATIDLVLRGALAFPVAEALQARDVPFVFSTGLDRDVIPEEYQDVPCWEKPGGVTELMIMLGEQVAKRTAPEGAKVP